MAFLTIKPNILTTMTQKAPLGSLSPLQTDLPLQSPSISLSRHPGSIAVPRTYLAGPHLKDFALLFAYSCPVSHVACSHTLFRNRLYTHHLVHNPWCKRGPQHLYGPIPSQSLTLLYTFGSQTRYLSEFTFCSTVVRK